MIHDGHDQDTEVGQAQKQHRAQIRHGQGHQRPAAGIVRDGVVDEYIRQARAADDQPEKDGDMRIR